MESSKIRERKRVGGEAEDGGTEVGSKGSCGGSDARNLAALMRSI